jgi:hypothetical protein
MVLDAEWLPAWVTWQHRPFPDANLLLLGGHQPAVVDSGFVGHVEDTAAWILPSHGPRRSAKIADAPHGSARSAPQPARAKLLLFSSPRLNRRLRLARDRRLLDKRCPATCPAAQAPSGRQGPAPVAGARPADRSRSRP